MQCAADPSHRVSSLGHASLHLGATVHCYLCHSGPAPAISETSEQVFNKKTHEKPIHINTTFRNVIITNHFKNDNNNKSSLNTFKVNKNSIWKMLS